MKCYCFLYLPHLHNKDNVFVIRQSAPGLSFHVVEVQLWESTLESLPENEEIGQIKVEACGMMRNASAKHDTWIPTSGIPVGEDLGTTNTMLVGSSLAKKHLPADGEWL